MCQWQLHCNCVGTTCFVISGEHTGRQRQFPAPDAVGSARDGGLRCGGPPGPPAGVAEGERPLPGGGVIPRRTGGQRRAGEPQRRNGGAHARAVMMPCTQ